MIVVAGLLIAAIIFVAIVAMLIRRQLREKYAVLWFIVGSVVLVLSVFPELFVGLTRALGVELPANLFFSLAIVLLLGVALHLSWELSRVEERIRRLAEEHAILRNAVDGLARTGGSAPASGQTRPGTADGDAGNTQ